MHREVKHAESMITNNYTASIHEAKAGFSTRKNVILCWSWDIEDMLHFSGWRWVTHAVHSCSKENQNNLRYLSVLWPEDWAQQGGSGHNQQDLWNFSRHCCREDFWHFVSHFVWIVLKNHCVRATVLCQSRFITVITVGNTKVVHGKTLKRFSSTSW